MDDTTFPVPYDSDAIAGILADERRRAIYLYVTHQRGPVTANQVSGEFQIHRNAAKFHLDKLLDAGLLRAEFKRINGRRGPGAGRPSKLYSLSDEEVAFSVPERHYDLLAHLLLQALTSGDGMDAVGYRFGRELAEASRLPSDLDGLECVQRVLDRLGFEPHVETDADGRTWITTHNCPFGKVAMEAPAGEVCVLDRAIVRGVLEVFTGPVEVRGETSLRQGNDVCVRQVVPSTTSRP